jgi:hypothetical protein
VKPDASPNGAGSSSPIHDPTSDVVGRGLDARELALNQQRLECVAA